MLTEQFETGSGGFVWQNLQPDELFSKAQFHVYTAFDMNIGKEWRGSQFVNHYNRIYYVKSGCAELRFKTHTLRMEPGHLYLIPPYQLLSHSADDELSFMWTHFQASLDAGLDLFMLYGHPCEVDLKGRADIPNAFTALIKNMQDKQPSAVLLRQQLLLTLLHPFMCVFDKATDPGRQLRHQSLLPALSLINQNISAPLSLKELAASANMSPEHFSRKFKSAFSVSPKRYMSHKRIAMAKQRLLVGEQSIERIAEECGYCDIFHFSRSFKKETGVTPSSFRREYDVRKLLDGPD